MKKIYKFSYDKYTHKIFADEVINDKYILYNIMDNEIKINKIKDNYNKKIS